MFCAIGSKDRLISSVRLPSSPAAVAPDRPIEHDQLGANRVSGACLRLADAAAQPLDQLAVRRRRSDGVDVGGVAARGRLAHTRPTVRSDPDRNLRAAAPIGGTRSSTRPSDWPMVHSSASDKLGP